jgi:hypothetical protein
MIGYGGGQDVYFVFDKKFWGDEQHIHLSGPNIDYDKPVAKIFY